MSQAVIDLIMQYLSLFLVYTHGSYGPFLQVYLKNNI